METCNASSCVGGVACGVGTTTARDGRRASGTAGGGGDSIRRAIVGTLSGGRGGSEGVAVAIEAGGSTGRISAEVAGVVSAGTGSVGAWAGPAATQRIAAWVIRSRDIVGSTAGKAANGANAEAGGAAAGDGLTSSTWGGNSALAGAGAITGAVLLETGCGANAEPRGTGSAANACWTACAVTSSGPISGAAAGTSTSISVSGAASRGDGPSTGACPNGRPLERIRPSK